MPITDAELARRVTRAERAKRVFIIFTAVMVTISLGILTVLAEQGAQRAKENRETLQTIRDCTQPAGRCYQRGKRQTASAVANINRVIILAAACASGLPQGLTVEQRQNAIQACVIDRLAAQNRHH